MLVVQFLLLAFVIDQAKSLPIDWKPRISEDSESSSETIHHPEVKNGTEDIDVDTKEGHIVQSPLDDEDLELVLNSLGEESFNKTGQLRYSSVPIIEKKLVEDLLDVIFSREEYKLLLNNPERNETEKVVREMLRVPTQKVLQQQLLHKILAIRAYYKKFIEPMIANNKRQTLINIAKHLLDAHENGTLTTEDAVELNQRLLNFAFFDRPEDEEFRGIVDELQRVFGWAINKTHVGVETTESPTHNFTIIPEYPTTVSSENLTLDNNSTLIPEMNFTLTTSSEDPEYESSTTTPSSTIQTFETTESTTESTTVVANYTDFTTDSNESTIELTSSTTVSTNSTDPIPTEQQGSEGPPTNPPRYIPPNHSRPKSTTSKPSTPENITSLPTELSTEFELITELPANTTESESDEVEMTAADKPNAPFI